MQHILNTVVSGNYIILIIAVGLVYLLITSIIKGLSNVVKIAILVALLVFLYLNSPQLSNLFNGLTSGGSDIGIIEDKVFQIFNGDLLDKFM